MFFFLVLFFICNYFILGMKAKGYYSGSCSSSHVCLSLVHPFLSFQVCLCLYFFLTLLILCVPLCFASLFFSYLFPFLFVSSHFRNVWLAWKESCDERNVKKRWRKILVEFWLILCLTWNTEPVVDNNNDVDDDKNTTCTPAMWRETFRIMESFVWNFDLFLPYVGLSLDMLIIMIMIIQIIPSLHICDLRTLKKSLKSRIEFQLFLRL